MGIEFGKMPIMDPKSVQQACLEQELPWEQWFGEANRMKCPLGVMPGRGLLLMRQADFDKLDAFTQYDLEFDWIDDAGKVESVTIKSLSIVRSTNLTPSYEGDPDSCLLVEVRDPRYLAQEVPIDKGYNVRDCLNACEYVSGTLKDGATWKWDQMIHDIWDTVGKLGSWTGLPFTPDGEPEGFTFWQMPAMIALDFALARLACALRWKPYTNTYDIVQVGKSDSTFDSTETKLASRRIWDDYPDEAKRGRNAKKARVLFRRCPPPIGESPFYAVEVDNTDTDLSKLEANSVHLIFDDLTALGSSGTPSNATALNNRAQERASDYWRLLKDGWKRYQVAYRGVSAQVLPGSLLSAVAWEDLGAGQKTIAFRGPPDQQTQKWAEYCCACAEGSGSGSGSG